MRHGAMGCRGHLGNGPGMAGWSSPVAKAPCVTRRPSRNKPVGNVTSVNLPPLDEVLYFCRLPCWDDDFCSNDHEVLNAHSSENEGQESRSLILL